MDAIGLFSALLSERKTTYNDGIGCDAKGGECRFKYPYNSHFNGSFWEAPIPDEDCSNDCPFKVMP